METQVSAGVPCTQLYRWSHAELAALSALLRFRCCAAVRQRQGALLQGAQGWQP